MRADSERVVKEEGALDERDRVTRAVKLAIQRSGLTQTEIERRIGAGKGNLTSILKPGKNLSLAHLFKILSAIERPAADFFAELYGLVSKGTELDALEREYHASSKEGLADFVDRRVRKILREERKS